MTDFQVSKALNAQLVDALKDVMAYSIFDSGMSWNYGLYCEALKTAEDLIATAEGFLGSPADLPHFVNKLHVCKCGSMTSYASGICGPCECRQREGLNVLYPQPGGGV